MSKQSEKERTQADSELFGLLESLLSEVGQEPGQQARQVPPESGPSRPFAEPEAEPPAPALLVEPVADLFREAAGETQAEILNKTERRPLESPEQEAPAAPPQRPEWAEGEFSSLMFRVRGQKLAIPVLELAGVVPCPDNITPIPGQPDWHMGVLEYRDGKMVAVDLTRLMQLRAGEETGRGCYLLAVGEGRYGLRCDAIPEPIKVDPQDVRWSQDRDGGGMLAGILSKQMCPLLNVDNILAQLRRHYGRQPV